MFEVGRIAMKKRIVCLVLGLVMMFSQTMSVFATTEQQLKQQKSQAQSQLNATNDEIDNLSRKQMQVQAEINSMDAEMVDLMIQIDATKEDIASTENSITETQNNITAKEQDITVKESDIQTKTGEIEQTKEELVQAEADRDQQYEDMKKRIKYIYENGGDSAWVNMIFGTDSFTSMLNRAEYAQSMHDYDRKSLEKYREVVAQVTQLKETLETQKTELENQKAELENQKAELESQKSELENQKASLESQKNDLQYQQNSLQASIDQKKAANSDYASQIEAARQQAREITNLIAQQNAELNRLAEERRAEEARRAAAAAEAARQEEARRQQAASQNSSNSSSSGSSTSSSSSSSSNKQETVKPSGVSGAAIVAYADQFVGNPYVWGGNSLTNGIDCSHFVYQILSRCGVYDGGYTTSYGWRYVGDEVTSLKEAQAGDVVCYDGHVALYDGAGGIVEAKGRRWGITHDRSVDYSEILTIRRVISDEEEDGENAQIIRDYLMSNGFSKAGAAGIMANIANESYPAFEPSSLELRSIHKTGISSDQYTALVDSGEISKSEFIVSSSFGLYSGGRYGYGLCGFTDPKVKAYLYHYTVEQGKSVGSISGQLDSLLAYLSDNNPDLLSRLKNAEDPETAASAFLREYERCANMRMAEIKRTAAARSIYEAMD